jgi:hypothetical protein
MNAQPEHIPDVDLDQEAIDGIHWTILQLVSDQRDPIRICDDPTRLAPILHSLRSARFALNDLERVAEAALHRCVPEREWEWEGFKVKSSSGKKKEWDKDRTLTQLVRRLVDPATGERVDAIPHTVVKKAAYISYFRVGGLKECGVDPKPLFEWVDERPTCQVEYEEEGGW